MNHRMIAELILTNAFELYGQPKWTFGKNTCNTYEVFAEKIHLPEGEVMPAWPIMSIIEENDVLSLLFSRWYLKNAIASAAQAAQSAGVHVTLSMNLLPIYASQPGFAQEVLATLEEYAMPPQKLQFELSEAQNLTEDGIENLNMLHDEHGVALYLANFGKGHSNVDLLAEVHFDGIELDRSYAAVVPEHEQTCRLVVAIQHLAHTLDLQVCAKGIETQDQFEFFEELGCLKGQGFLIGKPMKMDDMIEYLNGFAVKAQE